MLSLEALTTAVDAASEPRPSGHPGRPGARQDGHLGDRSRQRWRGASAGPCARAASRDHISASTPPVPLSAATTNSWRRCVPSATRPCWWPEGIDVTLPSTRVRDAGTRSSCWPNVADVHRDGMGTGRGPGETERFASTPSNPADHPARGEQDTFYTSPEDSRQLLRTHMPLTGADSHPASELPVTIIDRSYLSHDRLDATHTPIFHQVEGWQWTRSVDGSPTWTGRFCARRVRASARGPGSATLLPLHEPSAEVDVVVYPARLAAPPAGGVGECLGFAFGMGVGTHPAVSQRHSDMRDMVEGDVVHCRSGWVLMRYLQRLRRCLQSALRAGTLPRRTPSRRCCASATGRRGHPPWSGGRRPWAGGPISSSPATKRPGPCGRYRRSASVSRDYLWCNQFRGW